MAGDNYFGEDNCECLCSTCEKRRENGWAHRAEVEVAPKPSIEEEAASANYSLRRRRRLGSQESSSRNQSLTPDVNLRPQIAKRTPSSLTRFRNAESPLRNSPSLESTILTFGSRKRGSPLKAEKSAESLVDDEPSRSSKKRRTKSGEQSLPSVDFRRNETLTVEMPSRSFADAITLQPSPTSSLDASRRGSVSTAAEECHTSADATSVDDDTIVVQQPLSMTATIPAAKKIRGREVANMMEQAKVTEAIVIGPSTTLQHPAIEIVEPPPDSIPSSIDDAAIDSVEHSLATVTADTPSKTAVRSHKRKFEHDAVVDVGEPAEERNERSSSSPTPENEAVVRIPGDYVLTPALLAQPASAWINCSICEEPFVQEDAYFTRSSCPRCERHSKLYGYMWPKTDKEGRDDSEERVLDHRTVHRFIKPDEERSIRKKNRNVTESRDVVQTIAPEVTEAPVADEKKKKKKKEKPKPKPKSQPKQTQKPKLQKKKRNQPKVYGRKTLF